MILTGQQDVANYTIGGKAKGLCFLKKNHFLVPDFIIIPAETFDFVLDESAADEQDFPLRQKALEAFKLTISDSEKLKHLLAGWNFPEEAIVVRSSIADEDGESDTFAGLMNSFINVRSIEGLEKGIALCAASAYSERSVAYRKQKGLTLNARPAVIIQRQVNAATSGVIFSTYPQYPQELAIHAVFGFGEGLVSGELDADEFYLDKKTGGLVESVIAKKGYAYQINNNHLGLSPLTTQAEDSPSLTTDAIHQLHKVSQQIEKLKGKPQDIEFAIKDDEVFVLQCRSITQNIPGIIVYDNSNIQESYCGVTTPLTFSFAKRAYATVYTQTMQVLGLPKRVVLAKQDMVNNLLGLVHGRIYYNINNWYQGLQLLPSFKQNKEDMERMMGLEDPVDFIVNSEKTFIEKLKLIPRLLNLVRLFAVFRKLEILVNLFHRSFQDVFSRFYQTDFSKLSLAELWNQKLNLDKDLLQNWTTPIINDFFVMMTNGKVVRTLKRIGVDDCEKFLGRYLAGVQQVESIKPIEGLQELAEMVKGDEKLKRYLPNGKSSLKELELEFSEFYKKMIQYLDTYGDRVAGELKLETKTMRTNPEILFTHLSHYLDHPKLDFNQQNLSSHNEANQELEKYLYNFSIRKRTAFFNNLRKLQQSIRFRESMRLERTRLFGMYRTLYLAIGAQLKNEGILGVVEDVFYLEESEIGEAINKENREISFSDLVSERRSEFARYRSEEVPSRVIHPSRPVKASTEVPDTGVLQGKVCTRGIIEGEVVVIRDAQTDVDVKGKIICALRTDPGWAILFPSCKGVIIEKGSALSHSVILLRELQIPTIINIPNVSTILKTGMMVNMNANTGEVNIIRNEC